MLVKSLNHLRGHDFHSFRVTWVTMALAQGVPMELVRRVTGHSTVEVVLKHYFQPDRDNFRKVLEDKMPAFMTKEEICDKNRSAIIEQLREIIAAATVENFATCREKILEILN